MEMSCDRHICTAHASRPLAVDDQTTENHAQSPQADTRLTTVCADLGVPVARDDADLERKHHREGRLAQRSIHLSFVMAVTDCVCQRFGTALACPHGAAEHS